MLDPSVPRGLRRGKVCSRGSITRTTTVGRHADNRVSAKFSGGVFSALLWVLSPSPCFTARCVSSPRHRSRQRTDQLPCHAWLRREGKITAAFAGHLAAPRWVKGDGQKTHSRAEQKKKHHENIIKKSIRAREQIRTIEQRKHSGSGSGADRWPVWHRPQRPSVAD